ncbi:hypothetical protein P8452_59483 [Trifolium repens]|nr:hypothetical protein P8452_59483 [Trifolium repens]
MFDALIAAISIQDICCCIRESALQEVSSKRFTRDVVRDHLIAFGFQKGYDIYLGLTWENYTNLVKTVGSLKGNGILASLRHALLSMIPCRA